MEKWERKDLVSDPIRSTDKDVHAVPSVKEAQGLVERGIAFQPVAGMIFFMTQSRTTDFVEILKNQYESRKARNPRYSRTAFARDIGVSAGSLSLVLSRKTGLSTRLAGSVAASLDLDEDERDRFCDLVASKHARTATDRRAATLRLSKYDKQTHSLTGDAFRVVSDWYHFAIMELTTVREFQNAPEWIARKLGITADHARDAVERMKRLEILEIDEAGKLQAKSGFVILPSGHPNDDGKKFHEQVLAKALRSLKEHSIEERDFSSVIVRIRRTDLASAKKKLKDFRRTFVQELADGQDHDDVFCLSTQLFGLTV